MYILLRVYLGTELAVGRVGLNQLLRLGNPWKPPKSPREVEEGDEDKGWVDEPPSLAAGLASTLV
jgi:hypothetical protein